MNNAVFGKKHRDMKLVTTEKRKQIFGVKTQLYSDVK